MSLVRQQRKHTGTEHTFEKKWTKSGNCGTVMVPQFFLCTAASLRRSACRERMEVWKEGVVWIILFFIQNFSRWEISRRRFRIL